MSVNLQDCKIFIGIGGEKNASSPVRYGLGQFPDSLINSFLTVSSSIIKDMLGLMDSEDLPDDPRVDNAVYLLCLFYLENRSTQEFTDTVTIDEIVRSQRLSYYRANVREPLMKQTLGMLSKFRKVSRFIPDPSESA